MAEELLVDDQIDDGQRIIDQLLADGFDPAAAFWAKSDEGLWRLYIASPAFDDRKPGAATRAVYDSFSKVPDLTIEPALDIRLINDKNRIARDAIEIAGRLGKKEGIRYPGRRLGNLPIEEAYIYARPVLPLRQSFTITYVRQAESNEWAATTRRGELYRGMRHKGFVSSAHGPGDEPSGHMFALVDVWVEVNPMLDERMIATNPVILTTLADQARSLADAIFKKTYPEATIHHHDFAPAPV